MFTKMQPSLPVVEQQHTLLELTPKEEAPFEKTYTTEWAYALHCENTNVRHSVVTFFGKEQSDDAVILFMRKPLTPMLLAERPVELGKFKSYRVDVFTQKQLEHTDKLFLMIE